MMVQDSSASLNPRRTVGDAIAEGPVTHGLPRAAALERARELLALVKLDPGAADRYPHAFSGGQRQRIGLIAVMRDGAIVEQGATADVFGAPRHPYTRSLLDSVPGRRWTPPAGGDAGP